MAPFSNHCVFKGPLQVYLFTCIICKRKQTRNVEYFMLQYLYILNVDCITCRKYCTLFAKNLMSTAAAAVA